MINTEMVVQNEGSVYSDQLGSVCAENPIILKQGEFKKFKKSPINKLPYIRTTNADVLNIESPVLTNKEIDLLNTFLPKSRARFMGYKKLGFIPEEEKEKYFNNYRYYPAFVEARDF